jgi:hypothetical protein
MGWFANLFRTRPVDQTRLNVKGVLAEIRVPIRREEQFIIAGKIEAQGVLSRRTGLDLMTLTALLNGAKLPKPLKEGNRVRSTDKLLSGEVGKEQARQIAAERGKTQGFPEQTLLFLLRAARYDNAEQGELAGRERILSFYDACGVLARGAFWAGLDNPNARVAFDLIVNRDGFPATITSILQVLPTASKQNFVRNVLTVEERQATFRQIPLGERLAFILLCDREERDALYLSLNLGQRTVLLSANMRNYEQIRQLFGSFHFDRLPQLISDLEQVSLLGLLLITFASESDKLKKVLARLALDDQRKLFLGLDHFSLLDLFVRHMEPAGLGQLFECLQLDVYGFQLVYDNLSEGAKKIIVDSLSQKLRSQYQSLIEPSTVIWASATPAACPADVSGSPLQREIARFRTLGFLARTPQRTKEALALLGLATEENWRARFKELIFLFRDALRDTQAPPDVIAGMKALTMAREILLDRIDTTVFRFRRSGDD